MVRVVPPRGISLATRLRSRPTPPYVRVRVRVRPPAGRRIHPRSRHRRASPRVVRMLVSNYGGPANGANKQGWARDADANVAGTCVAKDTHAIVQYRGPGHADRVESP